jgi:hypothetical protein
MSNEKQQTAVEWLAEQMLHPEFHNPYIEQTLEMEKEQTKNRAIESYYLYTQYLEQIPKVGGATVEMDFEQFWEKTYGGNK